MITQRAVAITVEDNDSVYVHGDKLLLTGKPENRIVRAFRNVKLYKSNLSGKSDSLHTNQNSGLTQMMGRPILWNEQSQITGDSIHLISDTKTEKLDSLKVFDNAFIAQKDSISGYNQIKGQKLFGFFNEKNELKKVDIIKNAESIVYLREETGELIGIDKSKSASIEILFTDQTIDDVYKYKNPGGDIFPESLFLEQSQTFDGFNWRGDEKLLSKEDIFKGEAPFVLTKIEGIPLPEIDESFFADPDSPNELILPETSDIKEGDLLNRDENKPKFNNDTPDDVSRRKREELIKRNTASGIQRATKKPSSFQLPKTALRKKSGGQ